MELEKDKKEEEKLKKKKENYQNFHNSLIYFGTMKQRYLDKLKKKGE